MSEITSKIWVVTVTDMDRFSRSESYTKRFTTEKEAREYAASVDTRGQEDFTPDYYTMAQVTCI